MPTCGACGAEHAATARFCPACGTPLATRCASCGSPVRPDDVFCSHCGQRVAGTATAGPPGASPLAGDGYERKLVTILFADVEGSTALADRLDPERLREVLQAYFDAMREEIEAEGGTVEKFIGDAVMAAFGVPTAHEDDPSRALRAATAMMRRLALVNEGLATSHGVELRARIGVNTGEVLAATSPEPGGAMATGEAVNVAARLQGSAEPGEVLVSERTAQAARGFAFDDRGPLDLRGKRDPVRAFRLTGGSGTATRGVPYLASPMVGRAAELDVLDRVYARTLDEGRAHVVTIYGDAGVGKSRLVREFVARVQDRELTPLLLRGRCLPYGDGVTYWPLAEILKDHAGIRDTDHTADALAKIAAVSLDLEPAPEGDAPVPAMLAYTLGVADPDAPLARIEPSEVRRQLHNAWRAFLSGLAGNGPVVLVVEDIHWAGAALLDLLDELGERTVGPVLFVFPARPDLVATRPGWGGGRRNSVAVSLDPLRPRDAEHLVRLLLTIDDLPRSLHERILERADGNPFFLEEILRQLIDGGALLREDDRWRASPTIGSVELPDSVQGVLASRIDLLSAADKQVLQAAAVVGRIFWSEPVELLAPSQVSDHRLADSLRRLEEREMVSARVGSAFAGQPEYTFKHILTRDVAYESIPRRARSAAHAQVGRWLEHAAGERAGEFGELLAHHYGTAVQVAEQTGTEVDEELRSTALRWLLRASEDARKRFVMATSERLAHDALDLARTDVERCDALTALAEAYLTDVRGDLAWQYFERAAAVADAAPEIPDQRTAGLLARACDLPTRWPGSMNLVVPEAEVGALRDRGLALVGTADSPERAALLAISATWPFAFPTESTEPPETYVARGLEGVEIALRLGDPDLASACYDSASAAYSAWGDYRSMSKLWQRRWELRDRVTNVLELVDIYAMGSWQAWELGRYDEAIRVGGELSRWTRHGGVNHVMAWRGVSMFRLGRWDEAIDVLTAARDELDTRRDAPPDYMTHLYATAAIVHEVRGQRRDADRLAAVVAALPEHAVRVYAWRIQLALLRAENDRARRLLANPPASWQIHAPDVWEARCDAVLVLDPPDDPDVRERAAALAVSARDYAARCGPPSVVPFAARMEGYVAAASGDLARGVELLGEALRQFDELGAVWESARTRRLLAAALGRSGRGSDGAVEEAVAQATLRALGVQVDPVVDGALARL